MPPDAHISVGNSTPFGWQLPLTLSELEEALRVMLKEFSPPPPPGAVLELSLMDDAGIAELNLRYLQCAGPTNVLSFPAGDHGSLGWLALSVETVRREALLYKQNFAFYALKMLAHGLAHLLGYEHGEEMDLQSEKAAAAACARLAAMESTPCLKCS